MGAFPAVPTAPNDFVIRGFFGATGGRNSPMVTVGLFLPTLDRFGVVDFLVDTGASSTRLHPRDATLAIGLDAAELTDPERWSSRAVAAGIGGGVEYYRVPCRYIFSHEDSTTQVIHSEILIAQLRSENQRLPSLLGRDIIQHFQLSLSIENEQLTLS